MLFLLFYINNSIYSQENIKKLQIDKVIKTSENYILKENYSSADSLLKNIKFRPNTIVPNLKSVLRINLREIKKEWPKNLPKGIIHGDLFIDNIFFNKDKFSGFIDFYFSCNDYSMYEIAICINALCFDKRNNKFVLNNQKVKSLIKGYQSVKHLFLFDKFS